MSEPASPARPFYVTGGTLKPGEPSYVERRADDELFESLLAGEFCYVLTARQMGKSSLMARTAKRLEQAGACSAIVDLSQMGSERGDQASTQWYFGIANKIHQQLKITEPLRPWWQERADLPPVQRLTDFFRELVLTHCPGRVVIFVDEIDSTIGLPFADDFFAALRACFNARATETAFERLTFALLGVATPDQLIQDPTRTPFNIGKRIDLTDFSPEEARTLTPGLHSDPGEAEGRLERILYWTGGHPYLTQALCRAVRERAGDDGGDDGTAEKAVDPQVEELFLTSRAQREEANLKHARARLERSSPEKRRLLQLYRRVRQGKPVPDQPTSPLFAQLKLAGVVKATDEGKLAVRNRIYESVFTPQWASSAMPSDRGWQLAAATLAAALVGVLVWYAVFQPRPYEEAFRGAIKDDAYNVAFDAYKHLHANPFSRLRAAGFMQQFWEQRALRYSLVGKREESLLSYLQALRWKDDERLRRHARNLLGSDYKQLRLTLRIAGEPKIPTYQTPRDLPGVRAVAFSPDDKTIVTGSGANAARLWKTDTGKPLPFQLQHYVADYAVAFSPDGKILATGSDDGTACLWKTDTGMPFAPCLRLDSAITSVAFSTDGKTLAIGSGGVNFGFAQLWDIYTGKLIAPPLAYPEVVNAVAFSPDGQTAATGSGHSVSGYAQLLDSRNGRSVTSLLPHQKAVRAIAFSPDGRTLVTGSGGLLDSGTTQFWDTRTGKPLAIILQDQESTLAVAFSPDGRTLATASTSGRVQLWDAHNGKPLEFTLHHQDIAQAVAFSHDGRTLATGFKDNTARLWNVSIEKHSASPPYQESAYIVALSPDGRILAVVSEDKKTAFLRDMVTGKLLTPPLSKAVVAAVFSPTGGTLAIAYEDGTAQLLDTLNGRPLTPPLKHKNSILALALAPDGHALATGSADGTTRLWDTGTGKTIATLIGDEEKVTYLAFSKNSHIIATGSLDGTIRLWDARTGKSLITPLRHETGIRALAFSPDNQVLAIGLNTGTVLIKNAITGKTLSPPMGIQEPSAQMIAFHPNGKSFFVTTDHWLNTYSWDGKKAVVLSSQLLHGLWRSFRFSSDCQNCLQVALGNTDSSFHLETLRLDEPVDLPIKGDPKELLKSWQARLGLKFDEQMRPVPAVELPGDSDGDARRRELAPRSRQR